MVTYSFLINIRSSRKWWENVKIKQQMWKIVGWPEVEEHGGLTQHELWNMVV